MVVVTPPQPIISQMACCLLGVEVVCRRHDEFAGDTVQKVFGVGMY